MRVQMWSLAEVVHSHTQLSFLVVLCTLSLPSSSQSCCPSGITTFTSVQARTYYSHYQWFSIPVLQLRSPITTLLSFDSGDYRFQQHSRVERDGCWRGHGEARCRSAQKCDVFLSSSHDALTSLVVTCCLCRMLFPNSRPELATWRLLRQTCRPVMSKQAYKLKSDTRHCMINAKISRAITIFISSLNSQMHPYTCSMLPPIKSRIQLTLNQSIHSHNSNYDNVRT